LERLEERARNCAGKRRVSSSSQFSVALREFVLSSRPEPFPRLVFRGRLFYCPVKFFRDFWQNIIFPWFHFSISLSLGRKGKTGAPAPLRRRTDINQQAISNLYVFTRILNIIMGVIPPGGGAGVGPPSSAGPNKGFFKLRVDIGCGRYKLKKNANYSGVREVLRYLSVGNDRFTILTEGGLFE